MTTTTISQSRGNLWKVVAVALVLGVVAFLASPGAPLGFIWGGGTESAGPSPTGTQIALLMLITAFQSLVFGLGVAFLIFGYPLVSGALPASRGLALATYFAIAWSLVGWWPHSNLHQVVGENMDGLIAIEYGFHATTMFAGLITAYFFVMVMRQSASRAQ
jgi:hypothetical protein